MPTTRSLRRSRRLQSLAANTPQIDHDLSAGDGADDTLKRRLKTSNPSPDDAESKVRSRRTRKRSKAQEIKNNETEGNTIETLAPSSSECLPRNREEALIRNAKKKSTTSPTLQVIGVDEAGRGPLAGPVVAAAAIIPLNIPGIMDSKKLTKEAVRDDLYEKIVSSPNAQWAVAVSSSSRIDEINILQATLEAMRNAVQRIIAVSSCTIENGGFRREKKASSKIDGCYVVYGMNDDKGNPIEFDKGYSEEMLGCSYSYHALIDGNKVPKEMPCEAESMVKGDSKEYAIAAASIIAKVTRDRLMHEYDAMYPDYNLSQHKGYPTAAHMAKVREIGATVIHRRTFAPLKFMVFDDDGNIIEESADKKK